MTTPIPRVAIIGLGGFARHHHSAVLEMERRGEIQLVATCDPQPDKFVASQLEWDFAGRGVRVYADYLAMLDAHAQELLFVTVPTPIPLHAPMHRAVVERGLGCYLEKPPTLDFAELETMIEVDEAARFATQVGFNFIVEAPRQALKARLLSGEFGALRRANFLGFWPRSSAYFERAPWAGKLMLDRRLVLDSCAGNALAHHVHDALFWCGQDEILSWGAVHEIEAQLFRAHKIESFDTVFARAQCGGAEVRFAATHAGFGASWHREWVECERAILTYESQNSSYRIDWRDGREEIGEPQPRNLMIENLRSYTAYLSGAVARPLTQLSDCRPFVAFNNLLFVAAGAISSVEAALVETTLIETAPGGQWLAIPGIEAALENFGRSGQMPHQSGYVWGRAGGHDKGFARAAQVDQLVEIVSQMRRESGGEGGDQGARAA